MEYSQMKYRNRHMVKPEDLNGAGTLFGGKALSWIDEEAAIYAACQLRTSRLVTKFMSAIDFKAPAKTGDIVEVGTKLVALGRTSITISCSIRNKTTKEEILYVDKIVFVVLDENGKPMEHGVVEETLD